MIYREQQKVESKGMELKDIKKSVGDHSGNERVEL